MAQYQGKQIPLPEHLSWKLASIVEVIENWRVIHTLLNHGYPEEKIKVLFPSIDDDYFNVITEHFKQHGAADIEEVIKSRLEDYREKELNNILERMIKLEGFSIDELRLVTPDKYQEKLLSTEKLIEMSKQNAIGV